MQFYPSGTVIQRALGSFILALSITTVGLLNPGPARADVLLQGFYWDVPSPAAGSAAAPFWWDRLAQQAQSFQQAGFTAIWLPPILKGNSGGFSVGYDPFDDYDLGSKVQKGSLPLRCGNREQVERCVALLRANDLNVYVDLVENHRNGDTNFHFLYTNASGLPQAGRFQKGPLDFHPNVPQDPDVPADGNETGFGPDLAPINGSAHYVFNGLIDAADWMTRVLDVQRYRLDDVQGISTDWLLPFLNAKSMKGKFAIGEFVDTDVTHVEHWISADMHQAGMQNRASAFDFPLRGLLKQMCDANGFFDMRKLEGAGLAGSDPFHAVTFVENHDTDHVGGPLYAPITDRKALAYAYILTSEGYPCVFYRDYSMDANCYHMKPILDPLIRIHEKLALGAIQQRWHDGHDDDDVYAFERLGGSHLLVGLNDNSTSGRTITVDTGFGPHVALHDYVAHGPKHDRLFAVGVLLRVLIHVQIQHALRPILDAPRAGAGGQVALVHKVRISTSCTVRVPPRGGRGPG